MIVLDGLTVSMIVGAIAVGVVIGLILGFCLCSWIHDDNRNHIDWDEPDEHESHHC